MLIKFNYMNYANCIIMKKIPKKKSSNISNIVPGSKTSNTRKAVSFVAGTPGGKVLY